MMEGWEEVRFGDVVQFPPKIKMKKGESYPFIPMENLDSGIKYVKPIIEKELKGGGAKFEEGDTLFSRITPCLQNGKIAQAKNLDNKPAFGSTEYFVFRGIENVTDTDFIYYLSKSQWFKGNAENSMVGSSGRQRADAGFVRNLKINLPPLKTQRKIASILSGYDDLIENNRMRIKLLEEQAQQTYEEWFVRFKFPGYENVAFDEESGLPVGWERNKIMDVDISMIDGDRGKNYPKQHDFFDKEFCLFLNTGNVTSSGLDFNNLKFITKEKDSLLRNGKLIANDIIITTRGTIGNVAYYRNDIPYKNVRINSGMLILRSNSKNILSNYIYQVFISRLFQQTVRLFSYGAAQPQLPIGTLKNIKIVIPDFKTQNKFSNYVEYILSYCNNLKNQNQHLKEARDILLPRLMSGMIDVYGLEVEGKLSMVAEGSEKYN